MIGQIVSSAAWQILQFLNNLCILNLGEINYEEAFHFFLFWLDLDGFSDLNSDLLTDPILSLAVQSEFDWVTKGRDMKTSLISFSDRNFSKSDNGSLLWRIWKIGWRFELRGLFIHSLSYLAEIRFICSIAFAFTPELKFRFHYLFTSGW